MAVPVSNIVTVNITASPTPLAAKGFGTLIFMANEAEDIFAEGELVRTYGAIAEVSADFSADGEVMAAANAYFGQSPTPAEFMVGVITTLIPSGFVQGTLQAGDLATLQAVTAGGFDVDVDGATQSLTAVDLSTIVAVEDIVAIINPLITGATFSYSTEFNTCRIQSDTTGVASIVTNLTNDADGLLPALGLDTAVLEEAGGTLESVPQALSNAEVYNDAFYGVSVERAYRDSNSVRDICDWVQGREKQAFICSNDANMTSIATHDLVAIKDALDASYSRTHFVYGANVSEYPECSTAGRAFTVNFRGTNTTLTLFLKKLPGITMNDFSTSQREAVKELKVNAYVNMAGVAVYLDGVNGDGTFFDQVHGLDWLKNAIQTNIFNLLYLSPTKIPYNDGGTATLAGGVRQALDQGVRNGLISAGATADGTYLASGYEITVIPVADVSQADKGNRIYGGISFQAVGAGAIHEVIVSGTFTG